LFRITASGKRKPDIFVNVADYIQPSVGVENIIAGRNIVKHPVFLKNIQSRFSG
jgi:hypothetical protein